MDNKAYTDINIIDYSSSSPKASFLGSKNLVYVALSALIGLSLITTFMIFSKKPTTPAVSKITTPKLNLPDKKMAKDSKIALVNPSIVITKKVIAQKPKTTPAMQPKAVSSTYIVKAGDNLWKIAEQIYGNGFKAHDIAKQNKIAQANIIYVGQKLTLPKIQAKVTEAKAQVTTKPEILAADTKVSDKSQKYTVRKGDNLWNISVQFYGNGFEWKRIATANKLTTPQIIHSGNVLTIPPKQ